MGKKYIIELEETPFIQHFKNGAWETIYRVKGFNSLVFDWNGLQMLTPYTEPDLEQIRKEAYDKGFEDGKEYCPGQLSCMDVIYQKGFMDGTKQCVNCSASEAIEKIRQYEQEEKITKGDVVRIKSAPEVEILVTYADESHVSGIALTEVDGCCEIGDQYTDIVIHKVEKTGRHYEIAEVLRKMKENQ